MSEPKRPEMREDWQPGQDPYDAVADHEHIWVVGSSDCVRCGKPYDGRFDYLHPMAGASIGMTVLAGAVKDSSDVVEAADRLVRAIVVATGGTYPVRLSSTDFGNGRGERSSTFTIDIVGRAQPLRARRRRSA